MRLTTFYKNKMFQFHNLSTSGDSLLTDNFNVVINGREFPCVRWIAFRVSNAIKNYLRKNPNEEKYIFQIEEYGDINMIYEILCGKSIMFTSSSIPFLFQVASTLEIDSLMNELTTIQNKIDDIDYMIHDSSDLSLLISLEKLFLSLTKDNIEKVSSEIIEYSIENQLLSKYFLNSCVARPDNIEIYIELLLKVHEIQIENDMNSIIPVFSNFLITRLKKTFYYDEDKPIQQEMCFIIQNLIERGFVEGKEVIYQRTPLFFSHIMDESLFKAMRYLERQNYSEEMLQRVDANNFEEHKENIHIGKNLNDIALSIRNDDVESLQQSLIKKNFDYNGKIKNSIYERCSFVNSSIAYIEFAAFFGSIKCFKYLLLNKANKTNKLAQFAVGGGNVEIIHICEQIGCNFQDTLQVAIKYHRWEIFKWLISTNKIEYDKINEYITKCIFYTNYKSLMTLLKIGIDPSFALIESIRLNDLILTNFLINLNSVDLNVKDKKERGILQIACLSENCEIVECILNNTNIDVNFRTLHNDELRISH